NQRDRERPARLQAPAAGLPADIAAYLYRACRHVRVGVDGTAFCSCGLCTFTQKRHVWHMQPSPLGIYPCRDAPLTYYDTRFPPAKYSKKHGRAAVKQSVSVAA